jgi:hypothetical protein
VKWNGFSPPHHLAERVGASMSAWADALLGDESLRKAAEEIVMLINGGGGHDNLRQPASGRLERIVEPGLRDVPVAPDAGGGGAERLRHLFERQPAEVP